MVGESFQDLLDRYLLAHDREQVAEPTSTGNRTLLSGASCSAEALASRLPHRRLPLEPDEAMSIIFLSVVDVDDTRGIVSTLVDRTCAGRESRSFPEILENMVRRVEDPLVLEILRENLEDEYGNGDSDEALGVFDHV